MAELIRMSLDQVFELSLLPRDEQNRRLDEWADAGKVRRLRLPPQQLWLPLGVPQTPEVTDA
jgi:hypothetical protein